MCKRISTSNNGWSVDIIILAPSEGSLKFIPHLDASFENMSSAYLQREICPSDEASICFCCWKSLIALVKKSFSSAPKHMPSAIHCLFRTHHLQNCCNSLGFFFFPDQLFWDILWILQFAKFLSEIPFSLFLFLFFFLFSFLFSLLFSFLFPCYLTSWE